MYSFWAGYFLTYRELYYVWLKQILELIFQAKYSFIYYMQNMLYQLYHHYNVIF